MRRKGALKEELKDMVLRLERQIRETPVSAESVLYLSDSVVLGRVSYKAFIGDLSRDELEALEKRVLFVFLEVCQLPKSLSKELVHLAASLGGLGWTSWYDRLMKAMVSSMFKRVATDTPLGFMYRWALEQLQLDIGAGLIAGGDDVVTESFRDYPRTNLRWLEQAMVWMEERLLRLVGGGAMPGGVHGDVPLVDVGADGEERKILREDGKANGRVWLSQVTAS